MMKQYIEFAVVTNGNTIVRVGKSQVKQPKTTGNRKEKN